MSIACCDAIVTGKISYQMEVMVVLFSSYARIVEQSSPVMLVLWSKIIKRPMGYGQTIPEAARP